MHLLRLKPIRAFLTSPDLSIDIEFSQFQSRDTLPLNLVSKEDLEKLERPGWVSVLQNSLLKKSARMYCSVHTAETFCYSFRKPLQKIVAVLEKFETNGNKKGFCSCFLKNAENYLPLSENRC